MSSLEITFSSGAAIIIWIHIISSIYFKAFDSGL